MEGIGGGEEGDEERGKREGLGDGEGVGRIRRSQRKRNLEKSERLGRENHAKPKGLGKEYHDKTEGSRKRKS